MLRIASSTVVPNALRAIASPRILSQSITNYAFSSSDQNSSFKSEIKCISSQNFSTDAKKQIDHKLVKILKSEIKSDQRPPPEKIMPPPPPDFPFTIEDNPTWHDNITLTRELAGEKIQVVVNKPRHIRPEDDGEESDFSGTDNSDDDSVDNGTDNSHDDSVDTDNSDDDSVDNGDGGADDDSSSTDSISNEEKEKSDADPTPVPLDLFVSISKENGKKMKFSVSISTDEIIIEMISAMEPAAETDDPLLCFGPFPVEEDSELQFALREFLEIRGIKKSYAGFLYKYMVRKSKRLQYKEVLEELKEFIKKQ